MLALAVPGMLIAEPTGQVVELPCPLEIETIQAIPAPPDGLVIVSPQRGHASAPGFDRRRSKLSGIGLVLDGPESGAVLAPDTSSGWEANGDLRQHRWRIGSRSVWVSCSYSDTYLSLAAELPSGIHSCFSSYTAGTGSQFVRAWCVTADQQVGEVGLPGIHPQ